MALSTLYIAFLLSMLVLIICVSGIMFKGNDKTPDKVSFMGKDYTTVLKGLAILLIMSCHCTGNWIGGRLLTPWGGIGVCIFLIVSGYGLNESYRNKGLSHFWIRRIGKVWIPYAFMVFALATINGVSRWSDLGLQLLCIKSVYWFIPYIMECYIVFWLFSRFIPKYRMAAFLAVSVLSMVLAPEMQAEQALSFITGIWMSEHKHLCGRLASDKRKVLKLGCLFTAIGILVLLVKQFPEVRALSGTVLYSFIQLCIKWTLGLVVVLVLWLMPGLVGNPFLGLSGRTSYELYLVHFPFYTFIGEKFWPAIVLFIASFIISWLSNKLNRRIGTAINNI